jgi:hypothetical protein
MHGILGRLLIHRCQDLKSLTVNPCAAHTHTQAYIDTYERVGYRRTVYVIYIVSCVKYTCSECQSSRTKILEGKNGGRT